MGLTNKQLFCARVSSGPEVMLWQGRPLWFLSLQDSLSNNQQETLVGGGKHLLLTGPGNYTAHLGSHNKVVGREK